MRDVVGTVKFWNAERQAELRRLAAQGLNARRCALALGMPGRAGEQRVRWAAWYYDIAIATARTDAVARVLALHDAEPHLSAGKIAKRLGLTRNQAIGALVRHRKGWAGGTKGASARPAIDGLPASVLLCHFSIDNGEGIRDPLRRWCGARVVAGTAWCAEHYRRVFRPAEKDSEATLSATKASPSSCASDSSGLRPQLANVVSLEPGRSSIEARRADRAGRPASDDPGVPPWIA